MTVAPTPTLCPNCSAPAAGKFCAECGAAVGGATCAACRASLTPGARFCHRCGTPAGAAAPAPAPASGGRPAAAGSTLPWAVAGIALLALVAFAAARNFNARRGSALDGPSNAIPQAGLDFPAGDAGPAGRAPDISQMSPAERADRLHDRVMRLASQGRVDSVQFFLPMAVQAYADLAAAEPLSVDQRYHLGLLHEVGGNAAAAAAQADTILRDDPTHLLGLALAARAAGMRRDAAAQRTFRQKLLAAEAEEMAKTRPEYEAHRADLQQAIADAKKQ
ncbi:MAG: zinc ribbon domain-containing protein [Gemmatimonadaceae bacterium]